MINNLPCFLAFNGRKKTLVIFLISALVVSAGIGQPLSGTYTINGAVATGGTNFQSFNEAAYALSSGISGSVIFNVNAASGPYNEQVTFYAIPGSSATNTVTFNGNGAVIQFISTSSINRAGIKLDSADYMKFDSLKITPITSGLLNYEYGYGFQLIRDADHNTISRCTIINTANSLQPQNTEGIVLASGDEEANNLGVNECDSNLIANNTIIGGNSGITLFSFAGYTDPLVTIKGNRILNNTIRNFREAGIYLFGNENTLVQGNDISGQVWNSYSTGINVSEKNTKLTITGNRIHNISKSSIVTSAATFDGIGVTSCRNTEGNPIIISNNLIYDIRIDGNQSGLQVDNSTGVYFYHNTVVLDTAGASSGATTYGFEYGTGDSSIQFKNNIIYITRGGSSGKRGIYMANAGINFSCDYNDYYINASSGSNIIGQLSSSYTTLTAWQSATGKDYHSYTIDPLFPSATTNLKPAAGSLDNTGVYVNISSDIDNVTRSNTFPDMGAYEFLSTPCSTPPVAGTINAVPGLVLCAGSPVFLTANGNSGGIGQTYQWQTAATETGTYTNLGASSITTPRDAIANTTLFYRLQVTCGTATAYSTPIQIRANNSLIAGSYTINKTLPTAGTNYNSFADVLVALKCGIAGPVVFNVASGTGPYNEQVIIPAVTGTSATNTITFNGNGETLNYLSTSGTERAVLKLTNTSNIIIDSLTITALGSTSSEYGYGVQITNNSNNNIVRNSTININTTSGSNRYVGIGILNTTGDPDGTGNTNLSDSNTVINNTVIGGYWGIIITANTSSAGIVYNNKIVNNSVKEFYAIGISVLGTTNTLVEGNDCSRPTRPTATTTYGIQLNGGNIGLRVSKNRIHNLFDANLSATNTVYGISSSSADGTAGATNIYSNNAIYNINGLGIQYGFNNNSSDYSLYYHNTINLDAASTGSTIARGFYQTSTATGIQFRNNIVTITRGGTGINYGINMNTTGTTYTSDNNDFYIASATGTNYTGAVGTTNYATLANWQTATSKDAASFSIDPVYTSAATGNLKPGATTLNNKGTFVNITTDILNAIRSATTPDLGAWEFDDALPVKLIDINALKIASDVLVSWSTATEINSANFVIERSTDGIHFTPVGTVAAKGNSTSLQQYKLTDKNAVTLTGSNILYYRIKSVDRDGYYEYSKVVTVNVDNKSKIEIATFPNPFVNSLYVKIATAATGKALITVMDITGKVITTQQQTVAAGSNMIAVNNATQLPSGSYMIKVELNGNVYITKVVK